MMKKLPVLLKKMTCLSVSLWLMSTLALAASATTTEVIYSEPFETSLGAFSSRSLVGDQTWQWDKLYGAKVSGYASSTSFDNEDWLISPPMDLTNYKDIILNFEHAHQYASFPEFELQLWVTDTYYVQPGDTTPLPSLDTTNWVKLSFTKSDQTSWTFISSGPVSLNAFSGKNNVRFAFRYVSSTAGAATWEIKHVLVNGVNTQGGGQPGGETGVNVVVLAERFDKAIAGTPASPNATDIALQLDLYTQLPGWTGSKAYQAGGMLKFGTSSAMGSLSTPALDLSADSGHFEVSFKSMAWSGDSTGINLLLNGNLVKKVTGLPNTTDYNLASFGPFRIEGGTPASVLTFSGLGASKSRFYLDSLVITQIKDTAVIEPLIKPEITASSLAFRTELGVPSTKTLHLSGKNLTGLYKVEIINKTDSLGPPRFITPYSILTAQQLMSGMELPITYLSINPQPDTAFVRLYSPEHPEPYSFLITASSFTSILVPNLAALRQAYDANPSDKTTIYRVLSEVVVTYAHPTGNSKYVQDATGGLLIYDTKAVLDSIYPGNGLIGLTGTLDTYGGVTELIPTESIRPSNFGRLKQPVKLTIAEAKANKDRYESMLVQIDNLSNISGKTVWGTSKANYSFTDGKDTLVIRTNYTGLDYMNDSIPTVPTNFAGLLLEYNGTVQLFPRFESDINVTGTPDTIIPIDTTTTTVSLSGGRCMVGENIDLYVEAKGYTLNDNYISYQFDLSYDPSILSYEGAWDTDLTNGPHGALVINNPAPGLLRFSYMQTYALGGDRSLLMIRFKGLSVGETQPSISHFLFNTDTIDAVTTSPVIIEENIVYTLGDVDGNGHVQAYDAALTLQYSVSMEPLPGIAPRPWTGWRLNAADVDKINGITAYDAAMILRWSAGIIDTFAIDNKSPLRSAAADETDVIITQENGNLLFTAKGQLIGFNLFAGNQPVLGQPTLHDVSMLSAVNITSDNYAVGLAKAVAFEPGKPFMSIPLELLANNGNSFSIDLNLVINNRLCTKTVNIATGLDQATTTDMTLYPNPVKSSLSIKGLTPGSTVRIYNLNGKLCLERSVQHSTETLEMSSLPSGVYLLKQQSTNGETRVAKVVKQ